MQAVELRVAVLSDLGATGLDVELHERLEGRSLRGRGRRNDPESRRDHRDFRGNPTYDLLPGCSTSRVRYLSAVVGYRQHACAKIKVIGFSGCLERLAIGITGQQDRGSGFRTANDKPKNRA